MIKDRLTYHGVSRDGSLASSRSMIAKHLSLCGLVMMLAACGDHSPVAQADSGAAATPPKVHDHDRPACPSQNFEVFLDAFADDIALQRAFVHDPLENESVDANAEPEPKPVTRQLERKNLSFPLMPSTQQQRSDGLQRSMTASGPDEMQVKLAKGDSDYQMTLVFRHDDCWTLYRKQDDSL